jgi:hypothetical protein
LRVKPVSGLPEPIVPGTSPTIYPEEEKPVFFDHYWLEGAPTLFRANICGLDFSMAKEGRLAAYRFEGEKELKQEKWVYL